MVSWIGELYLLFPLQGIPSRRCGVCPDPVAVGRPKQEVLVLEKVLHAEPADSETLESTKNLSSLQSRYL